MVSGNSRYFPRNIGVANPPGRDVYEFLVVWDSKADGLSQVLGVFSRHEASVLLSHSQVGEGRDTVVGMFFCELVGPGPPVETLLAAIKKLSFVSIAEYASAQSSLFERFLFPVTVWGRERVIVMRLDPLLNIENRLMRDLGSAGGAIMFREGVSYAVETIHQYKRVLGDASYDTFLENVKDGLRAMGWGLFDFKKSKDGYAVTVQDAPMLVGSSEPSRFLCGMVVGILETLLSAGMKITMSTVEPENGRVKIGVSRVARDSESSG